jgi:hypothetical protein
MRMLAALQEGAEFDAIDIISHGASGLLMLGAKIPHCARNDIDG